MNTIKENLFRCILCVFILLSGCKKESSLEKRDWRMTFNDEFSNSILNRSTWRTSFPWGQSSFNIEPQLYIDSAFSIHDGVLYIEEKRDTVIGTVYDENFNPVQKEFFYTSGMIQSLYSFTQQYGYFEVRSKSPFGVGISSAFWMMPTDIWPPEIDIYELYGEVPNRLHMTNHFIDRNGDPAQNSITINTFDLTQDFHTYAVEWNPKEIIWYLDNEKVFSSESGVPNERMYLVLGLGLRAEVPGFGTNATILPSYFLIDYVRAYTKD